MRQWVIKTESDNTFRELIRQARGAKTSRPLEDWRMGPRTTQAGHDRTPVKMGRPQKQSFEMGKIAKLRSGILEKLR